MIERTAVAVKRIPQKHPGFLIESRDVSRQNRHVPPHPGISYVLWLRERDVPDLRSKGSAIEHLTNVRKELICVVIGS